MSSYFPSPSGGLVHRFSHVGGPLQTPAGIPGSQYPSESGSFGDSRTPGMKLYPFSTNFLIGKPLFARASNNYLAYTPPS